MSHNENNIQEIRGKQFSETLKLVMPFPAVYIQPPFYLNEMEFNIISKPNIIETISWAIFIFAITLSIEIFAKAITLFLFTQNNNLITLIFTPNNKFEQWKLIATGLSFILWLMSLLLRLIPSKKRKLMTKIRNYYRDNPPLLRGIENE
jgi:hypothetical protein